jgi:hypothetical protein
VEHPEKPDPEAVAAAEARYNTATERVMRWVNLYDEGQISFASLAVQVRIDLKEALAREYNEGFNDGVCDEEEDDIIIIEPEDPNEDLPF